ncbi:tyrosine-protein phosphatase [Nocardioides ultimimeridianus]
MSETADTAETNAGSELLRLATADNFRDVAGDGYVGADGRPLATGVFFRSNDLRLSGADLASLAALAPTSIIDLRTTGEIAAHPDPEIPGTTLLHFDVMGIPMEEVAGLRTRAAAVDLMDRTYRGFVTSEKSRVGFAGVLRALAEDGPHVFHCTAGKDRTGWVSALLHHLAGVDRATIEADYLLTNIRSTQSRASTEEQIRTHLGEAGVEIFEPTLVADLEYLHAAYQAVEETYGDLDAYLRDGLGLDDATLDRLRERLLG